MEKASLARRTFLKQAGVAGGLTLLAPALTGAHPLYNLLASAQTYVRPNVKTFSQDAAKVATLRKGVGVMMKRPMNDPTSWMFQANVHGVPSQGSNCPPMSNSNPAWAQCEHGSYFFLSWHRMYLYFFERILRAATGDNNFALPYWNYSDPADHSQRALPLIFRQPADATNPLYTASRNTAGVGMNNGARLTASAVSTTKALQQTIFCNSVGAGSFGGQIVPGPVHYNGGFGELESTPHNVVHDQVGGSTGLMSDPDCAARDPIFWFHHANIDRLWDIWLSQGGGRQDAVNDKTWRSQKFTFYDEKKVKHTMTACDILNAQTQLGYSYEGEPPQVTQKCPPLPTVVGFQQRPEKLIARTAQPSVELGAEPTTVQVALPPENRNLLQSVLASPQRPEHVFLHVEGLEVEKHPGVIYEVYVNLPPGTTDPDPESPYHVGNLSFFGFKRSNARTHGRMAAAAPPRQSFDITDVVRRGRNGTPDLSNVSVTFVPRGTDQPEGVTASAAPQRLQLAERPRFSKLSITVQ
ncbi:MAG: tyrosinase family protein [Acidobacteriota bacterium]|nr:tyrosinase family protein [Acidobacteriota bacterium]